MTTITALPTPPTRSDPSTFAARADAFVDALPDFVTEANAVASEVNANATAAEAAAALAEANGVAKWVAATYAEGDLRWSPSNHLTYRNILAGASATDPAQDGTRWALLVGEQPWLAIDHTDSPWTATALQRLLVDATGGNVTINLLATDPIGTDVTIADAGETFGLHTVTVVPPAGETIEGDAAGVQCDVPGECRTISKVSATNRKVI